MAAGGFQNPDRNFQLSGTKDECQEDVWNDLLSLSGRGQPVGSGVQAVDNGRRTSISREAAMQGAVFGVWGEIGIGVACSLSTDTSW